MDTRRGVAEVLGDVFTGGVATDVGRGRILLGGGLRRSGRGLQWFQDQVGGKWGVRVVEKGTLIS